MAAVMRTTEELLKENPSLAAGLRAVLDVHREHETRDLEVVPRDADEFGEDESAAVSAIEAHVTRLIA